MTKQYQIKSAELKAVEDVRFQSILQLKSDFKNNITIKNNKYYDTRVYISSNGDAFYPYMFSKTLEHDTTTGFPLKDDVDKIIEALNEGTEESLDAIPQSASSTRRLEGVLSCSSFNLMGTDSVVYAPTNFFHVDTEEGSFEMAEVYARSLLRDVNFKNYSNNDSSAIMTDLNTYTLKTSAPVDNGNITAKTLFRGTGQDETIGPYISQYLLCPFNYGNMPIEQKFTPENDQPQTLTKAEWLNIQNGSVSGSIVKTNPEYIWNGRVLGSKVHNDPLFQFYYNAALISIQNGIKPETFHHPKTSAWTSGGSPNLFASVAHVCQGALRCAWNAKYNLGMKIRPEVYAARLALQEEIGFDSSKVPGLDSMASLMTQGIKTKIKAKSISKGGPGKLYLLLQFPEGSPTHPSWCAGHAAVAGAATTVLKAMLNCHEPDGVTRKAWPIQAKEARDQSVLQNYTEDDASQMTIIGELNKLGSNVTLGRDFAGVHYRCDGDCGIKLGEDYAITYLIDVAKEYHESQNGQFKGWLLEKYDGSRVKITSTGATAIA
jgi:hypothetical protein|tara:strand:- start:272 stop:1909 length:1638 start_codon:yes stop_codon:yes gene_type:complete